MEKLVYNEDVVSDFPTTSRFFDTYQALKDELSKMEAEHDVMLSLLRDLVEAEDSDEFEEVMARVKDFAENREFIVDY